MKKINFAYFSDSLELAHYIKAVQSPWYWKPAGAPPSPCSARSGKGLECPINDIQQGGQIRLAIIPFNLPWHLKPHNPEGFSAIDATEGDKFRFMTLKEVETDSWASIASFWCDVEGIWKQVPAGGTLSRSLTYRVPINTRYEDWNVTFGATGDNLVVQSVKLCTPIMGDLASIHVANVPASFFRNGQDLVMTLESREMLDNLQRFYADLYRDGSACMRALYHMPVSESQFGGLVAMETSGYRPLTHAEFESMSAGAGVPVDMPVEFLWPGKRTWDVIPPDHRKLYMGPMYRISKKIAQAAPIQAA